MGRCRRSHHKCTRASPNALGTDSCSNWLCIRSNQVGPARSWPCCVAQRHDLKVRRETAQHRPNEILTQHDHPFQIVMTTFTQITESEEIEDSVAGGARPEIGPDGDTPRVVFPYRPVLDVVRFLAAMWVMLDHAGGVAAQLPLRSLDRAARPPYWRRIPQGRVSGGPLRAVAGVGGKPRRRLADLLQLALRDLIAFRRFRSKLWRRRPSRGPAAFASEGARPPRVPADPGRARCHAAFRSKSVAASRAPLASQRRLDRANRSISYVQ
jgi:hypothetical protein